MGLPDLLGPQEAGTNREHNPEKLAAAGLSGAKENGADTMEVLLWWAGWQLAIGYCLYTCLLFPRLHGELGVVASASGSHF